MITFAWSLVAALSFTASGLLLGEGEFRLAGGTFVFAWLWLVFPKIPTWGLKKLGELFHGRRASNA